MNSSKHTLLPEIDRPGYSAPLHAIALLTAAATFPLIFMGGLVTTKGAGLSVPDWPNSYGYNMFLFPPSQWVGGIFYEHVHRLMASVVGFCAIGLTVAAWRWESRRWARWLCTGVLGMVIFQGVLGGLRVVLVQLNLAIVHACTAQAFFCLAVLAVIVTGRWWLEAPDRSGAEGGAVGRRLVAIAVVTVGVIYSQLMIGAVMRHYQAGLAIPGVSAYGHWFPPISGAGLAAVNQQRAWQYHMGPVTLAQLWLNMGHRLGAGLVSVAILTLGMTVLELFGSVKALVRPVCLLGVLLVTQVTLGVLTIYFRKPADVTSAHVAVGALVLATAFVIAVRAMRLYSLAFRGNPAPVSAGGRSGAWDAGSLAVVGG